MIKCFLVLASLLALVACKPGPAPSAPGDEPIPTAPAPDPMTQSPTQAPTTQAPTTTPCTSDDQCVITCARPSECCDQLCEPCGQSMHKDDLAAHQAWRAQSCSNDTCPVARCRPPTEKTVARCQAGACVAERSPI